RILIVEGNVNYRKILEELVRSWYMNRFSAEAEQPALELVERTKANNTSFSLILLDAQMPGLDGFAVADLVQKDSRFAGPVVIMLTSAGLRGDAARCRELGIRAYLPKPVKRSDLLEAIRMALGSQNQMES